MGLRRSTLFKACCHLTRVSSLLTNSSQQRAGFTQTQQARARPASSHWHRARHHLCTPGSNLAGLPVSPRYCAVVCLLAVAFFRSAIAACHSSSSSKLSADKSGSVQPRRMGSRLPSANAEGSRRCALRYVRSRWMSKFFASFFALPQERQSPEGLSLTTHARARTLIRHALPPYEPRRR